MISRVLKGLALSAAILVPASLAACGQATNPKLPTLFLVGDLPAETAAPVFDPAHLNVIAAPAAGQTTRAFIHSGSWDKTLERLKTGDFVLIDFAPRDMSSDDRASATRTLEGIGDGTFDYLDPGTQKLELVHSYGWYLRRMVVDVVNHGGIPVLCASPGGPADATTWARAIATEQRVPLVDLAAANSNLRQALEAVQPDPLAPYLKPGH